MKCWKYPLIIVLLLQLVFLSLEGCVSTPKVATPTEGQTSPVEKGKNSKAEEVPFTTSTGAITGRILYRDGTPGYKARILIVSSNDTWKVLDSTYGDSQGYYTFANVQPGTYWVNTAPNRGYSVDEPDAIVTVVAGKESPVETLTSYKDLSILQPASNAYFWPRTILQGPTFTFSWTAVPNAAYYELDVWSTYTEEHPSNNDYDEKLTTTNTTIMWPTDLSKLPYNNFRLDVDAYTREGLEIAYNYVLFSVGQYQK